MPYDIMLGAVVVIICVVMGSAVVVIGSIVVVVITAENNYHTYIYSNILKYEFNRCYLYLCIQIIITCFIC